MKNLIIASLVAFSFNAVAEVQTTHSIYKKLFVAYQGLNSARGNADSGISAAESIGYNMERIRNQVLAGQPVDLNLVEQSRKSAVAIRDNSSNTSRQISDSTRLVESGMSDLQSSDPSRQFICFTLDGKGTLARGESSSRAQAEAISKAGLRYAISQEGCSERPVVNVDLRVETNASNNGVQCTVISGKSRRFEARAITEADALSQAFAQCGKECGEYRLNSLTCVAL